MRRVASTALIALALVMVASLTGPEAALADRCQPEEIVLQMVPGLPQSPLGPDESDPRCPVMQAVLYDNVACDQSKFLRCVNSINAAGTVERQRGYCYDRLGFRVGALVCSRIP